MSSSVSPSHLLALIHESCFNVPAWTQLSCGTKTRVKVGAMAQTIVTVGVREEIPTPLPHPIRGTMGQDSRPEVQLLHPTGGASSTARIHSFITCSLSTYYAPAMFWSWDISLLSVRNTTCSENKTTGQGIGQGPGIQYNFDRGNQARFSKELTFEQRPETKPGVSQRKSMSGTEGIVTSKGPGVEMSTCPPNGKPL